MRVSLQSEAIPFDNIFFLSIALPFPVGTIILNSNINLVRECILYYSQYWANRCEIANNESKQKERLLNWYQNLYEQALVDLHLEARKYTQKYKLDTENATNTSLKKWIYYFKEFKRKLNNFAEKNNIR